MKVRKQYVLYVNSMLGTATYGNAKFGRRIDKATLGTILNCTLSELKGNLKILRDKNYLIGKCRY